MHAVTGLLKGLAAAGVKRLMVAGMFFTVSVGSLAVMATGAVFTDTQSVSANTFATGTVDITTTPTSAAINLSNMAPGNKVTAALTVSNAGSLQMRYSINSTTSENILAGQLDLTIKSGVTTCTNAGFTTDGTTVYGAGDLGNSTGLNLVGNPTQGNDSGDRVVDGAANEVLCFQVSLPLSTGNSYQGLTTTATLDFISEQTANN